MQGRMQERAASALRICSAMVCGLLSAALVFANRQASIFEVEIACQRSKGSLRVADLTVLGFEIGASSIRDVQKRFPGTTLVRLTNEEESEEGICLKDRGGMAVVLATGVFGAPDTLTGVYLAPVRLVESRRLHCRTVDIPEKAFSSASGIYVGAPARAVSLWARGRALTDGPFCAAFETPSKSGPLKLSKGKHVKELFDSTGIMGEIRDGKLEWVRIYGIAST